MFLRSWLILNRIRLIICAAICVLAVLFALYITSADSILDYGVLWHHFCGCPLDPGDTGVLLSPFMVMMVLGIVLGIFIGLTPNIPGARNGFSFRFTRPVSRRNLLLSPVIFSTIAMAVLPVLSWLLLLGWLKLVHAPALGHMLGLVELVPSASGLGPHPSFFALMSALHMGRRFVADLSVGLCVYMIFSTLGWLVLHPDPRIQKVGMFSFPVLYCIFWLLQVSDRLLGAHLLEAAMLLPHRHQQLVYLPSNLGIELHFLVAAILLFACWRLFQRAEI